MLFLYVFLYVVPSLSVSPVRKDYDHIILVFLEFLRSQRDDVGRSCNI